MDTYQTIKDIVVPVEKTSFARPDTPLDDVITLLRDLSCGPEKGCSESGSQTILVMDDEQHVLGVVDFQTVMKVLVPEMADSVSDRVRALWDMLGQVSKTSPADDAKFGLTARLLKNARRPISDAMLRIRKNIGPEADLLEAIMALAENSVGVLPVYDGDKLIGIVKDSDLFLMMGDVLRSLNKSAANVRGHPVSNAHENAIGSRGPESTMREPLLA